MVRPNRRGAFDIMQNIETYFEKDSQLGRNDPLAQKSANSSRNKWTEAMKTVPAYTEHMKQVESETVPCQDAEKLNMIDSMCKEQDAEKQNVFDVGIILYIKGENIFFEKQIEELVDSLREYNNAFILHPKHIYNIEYDSVFPQIMVCFQGKDDEYKIERVEDFNYDQMNAISEGKLVSACNELSAILYKRFRQRILSGVMWAKGTPLIVITDGDFLDVVSKIKGINGFRSNCIVIGLSDNYRCCYDKEFDDVVKIHHMSQIADILLFHRSDDYSFPVTDDIDNIDDIASIDDEGWL